MVFLPDFASLLVVGYTMKYVIESIILCTPLRIISKVNFGCVSFVSFEELNIISFHSTVMFSGNQNSTSIYSKVVNIM